MPNRTIKESARYSVTLAKLSADGERLFWRLITFADDFGRFEADPVIILGACFPRMLDRIGTPDVARWLAEMVEVGLVGLYRHNDKVYGYFPTWYRHNRRRAQYSKYPDPPPPQQMPLPTSADTCPQMSTSARLSENREARSETRESRSEERDANADGLLSQQAPTTEEEPAAAADLPSPIQERADLLTLLEPRVREIMATTGLDHFKARVQAVEEHRRAQLAPNGVNGSAAPPGVGGAMDRAP